MLPPLYRIRKEEWEEACAIDRAALEFYLDIPRQSTSPGQLLLPDIENFDLVDLFDILDSSTTHITTRKESTMSITSDVKQQINNGLQHIDDIVAATGYTNMQVYSVVRELLKHGKATQPVGGAHGVVVLNGQSYVPKQADAVTTDKPAFNMRTVVPADRLGNVVQLVKTAAPVSDPVTEEIKALIASNPNICKVAESQPGNSEIDYIAIANKIGTPEPAVKQEPFTVDFDFNSHFDRFIETMTHAVVKQIEKRVEGELNKLSDNMGEKIVEMVRVSSEGIIDRVSGQLTKAMEAVRSIQTEIAVPATTATVTEIIGQQPPKTHVIEQPKVRLPKVCVAGMLPIHAGTLSVEFSDTFDLVFWNDRTGSSNQQLQEYSQNCEAVFWHLKHSSHSAEKIVKKYSKKLIRVPGTLSAMRDALTAYYCNQEKTA